jgi:HEPN superfamily AbiU2-like protein
MSEATEKTVADPKTVLNEFYNLCVEARCDFDLYRSLFENDPRSTGLCVDYAPYFFNDFGRIITRTLVLHVCRLTDPPRSFSRANLTTNYILEELPWPADVKDRLTYFNDLLMTFRSILNPARNKRIAHIDLHSQIGRLEVMGRFDKGEDKTFFLDLQSFFDVAYRHVHNASAPAIALGASTDTYKVIRAIEKATLYDRCYRCSEAQRATDVLDFEQR